jgi:hypothetical protein
MAKPICVIKIDRTGAYNGLSLHEVQKGMEEKMPDYYVFVLPFEQSYVNNYDEPIQLQVFHEKDLTEIQYEELKKLVMDGLLKNEAPGEPGAV